MRTCPKCKTTGIPDEAKFCPVCGEKIGSFEVDEVEAEETTEEENIESEEGIPAWVYGLLAMLIFLGVVVILSL